MGATYIPTAWKSSTAQQIEDALKWASLIGIVVAVYWKIYADGQASERAKQVAEKPDAVREREEDQ